MTLEDTDYWQPEDDVLFLEAREADEARMDYEMDLARYWEREILTERNEGNADAN
jgi:ketosteroid isomerase-like protein